VGGFVATLVDDGISIPESYTSFIAPLSAHKVWADVKHFDDVKHFETAYVVKVFNCMELAAPLPVFTFVHPNRDAGMSCVSLSLSV
jgi:type II protein arginine methyltransferase